MRTILSIAEQLNQKRKPLKLGIHWIPGFILSIYDFIKWFFKVYLYAYFIFFPFFFTITGVASGSMTPTCQTNEIVLSSKIGYGIKLSKILPIRTEKEGWFDKYLWQYDTHKIDDIITFQVPMVDKESVYTKRIVANEGDTVEVKNGVVIVNGMPAKLKFLKTYTYMEKNKTYSGNLYEETLPNGAGTHEVFYLKQLGTGNLDNTEKFVVPKGCVLGIGDNRHMSDDGRSLIGFIEKRDISGKVVMVLFSNGNLTSLNIKKFIKGIRLDRCLKWMT